MRGFTFVLAASLIVPPSTLFGQQPPLEPGARVLVTAPDCGLRKQPTTLEAWGGDTLVLGMTECPLDSVTSLEVSRGQASLTWRGAGIGFIIGAAIGAPIGGYLCGAIAAGIEGSRCSVGERVLSGAMFGVPLGGIFAMFGAAIGSTSATDHWEEVPLDRLRVSFAPQRDGFAVGVRVAF